MFKIILSDINSFMDIYFIKSICLGLFFSLMLLCILSILRVKGVYRHSERRVVIKTLAFFLWIIYGYMVLGITYLCREPIYKRRISLIPFTTPAGNTRLLAFQVENVLMFIPYGVLLPVLIGYCRKWYTCLAAGIISSLFIEIAQYITYRGQAQIDDLLMNSAGTMIGWLIFQFVARSYKGHIKNVENVTQSDNAIGKEQTDNV